jgi:hypothetical protein
MSSKPIFLIIAAVIGVTCALATAQTAQTTREAEVASRIERLQARVEKVESVRAIKRLQYAYGHYVELGLWNDFADLFTDDAATNYQQGARGRAQVRELFFQQVGQGKLGLSDGRIYPHILFQPVITLGPDGRTAKGRWRILAMLGGMGGTASWYSGVYENEYVLQDGVWKISVLNSQAKVTAAYTAAGWRGSATQVPFHYTAASVSASVPDGSNRSVGTGGTSPSLASLADRVNQLAARATRLNDQAEVTNLQDNYGYAVDRKLWDQVANLFVDDGTLELGQQGVYVGKASIRRGLDQFGPQGLGEGELNDHVYLQTLVTVAPDGRTANARGVELIMSSAPGGRNGELSEGTYENSFVKQNGAWKIQSVRFYPRMIVDAAAGWAKSAKPAPGPSKEFPPDRPPTTSYEIYPKFAVAPFHFDNPVTGKAPQYPAGVQTAARPATRSATAPAGPEIRNTADLEARVAEVERRLTQAEAYDAAENLIGAFAYYQDEAPGDAAKLFARDSRAPEAVRGTVFANQTMQPVIEISADGKSARVRARQLNPAGVSGGAGSWVAGALEGQIIAEDGAWRFQTLRFSSVWSAPYPGGWARVP